ncbi:hypothetical protein O6H91_21G074800 [Diphasiastrum complanatum]|uniref:Uncharacterized protein n=1 Tax=Diphasiastrum complanatum TaxID=34168 RepID=A0ACC2ALY2_DIPCM|nr:hypothetical protein O6H91_21G074800 [Diphasiastrum complanatum]
MAPPVSDGGGGGAAMVRPVAGMAAPAQQQQQPGIRNMLTGVLRMAIFWYFASQMFGSKKPVNPAILTHNLFSKGERLDMWFYISEEERFSDFGNESLLIWHEVNIPYAVWSSDSVRHYQYLYHPSQEVKHNGSIYAHIYFARAGFSPDPNDQQFDIYSTFHRTISLVKYLPKPKVDKRKNLLDNKEQLPIEPISSIKVESEDEGPVEWISFWKPNVTINLVEDFTQYPRGGAPQHIAEYLAVEANTGNYYPTVFLNEFWMLKDKLIPVNETVDELVLNIEVGPISLTRWQLYLQIDQSFQTHRTYGSMLDGEADELKRVFLEGNPYLLAITMVVSMLHSVFDFLAFKNDIQFWNKNKSMEGLSARSVVVNFVCQLIIFLYLLDNETSWMIILSSGIGCCIEFWKIGKAMHIEVDRSRGYPLLKFRDRDSYAQNKTKEYDDMAMRYLSYGLYPLVGCFAIYSLLYERHRSWYSWILSSLTSCVYTFGFIMMCPQLFINYKMKSVAHLPWRQMTYKFLNTIIDDLFAFVIKMPILHRLSVFRDDLVFCVYIYQRWIYPVDTKRVNEFGFGGSDEKTEGEGNLNSTDSQKSIANDSAELQSVSDKVTRRLTGARGLAENGTSSKAITHEVDNKKRN